MQPPKISTLKQASILIFVSLFNTLQVYAFENNIHLISHEKQIIRPNLGKIPLKGESRIDPTTGFKITRLTDSSELINTKDALIVYSRYTPENSNGQYFLAFGDNSTSSWVIERKTGKIVANLRYDQRHQIGESHEVRWDTSGKYPNRIYFRNGMKFFMIDDVTKQDITRKIIKDFSSYVPQASKIYNDVEGDSSNDNDHWVWMAAHYDGATYKVDAFIHYQISTQKVDILRTKDLQNTPLHRYSSKAFFPRPNMVEVSPLGTGLVLHYGRAWGNKKYGRRAEDINTWFDGPHLWPLDFNFKEQPPTKISIGETHSGWAFNQEGREYFISQNNRTDKIDAVKLTGDNSGFNNRKEIASHEDFGWSNGFHFGKMPYSIKGWVFLSTYSKSNKTWGDNQLIMLRLDKKDSSSEIFRIGSNYNSYNGKYRDEAPAAINFLGNRIYLSNNWGGILKHREIFVIELPNNWQNRN